MSSSFRTCSRRWTQTSRLRASIATASKLRQTRSSATASTASTASTWAARPACICSSCCFQVLQGSSASLQAGCAGGCASRGCLVPTILPESSMDPLSARILDLAAPIWGPWTIAWVVCRLLVSRLRLRGAGFSPPERTQHHPEPVAFYTMRVTPPYRASPRWPPRCRSWPSPSRRPGWAAGRPRTSPRP